MKGACYIRVSSEEQTEFSPDAQLRAIKEYCKKNGIELDPNHIYIDAGISGRKAEKRPAFQQMIWNAKKKMFDIILVHKYDRFARNVKESRIYKELLRKDIGVDVVSITEEFGDDKNSFLLEGMLEIMAEYYSLNLSDEVKKGQLEKVRKGGNVSKLPYGYKTDNGSVIIVEEEAKIIKLVFRLFLDDKGKRTISRQLEKLGVVSKYGKPWAIERIDYILNNPIYAGYIRRGTKGSFKNGEVLIAKGNHEPIIDNQTWVKTKEKIKLQKQIYSKYQKKREDPYWLNGLLRCSNCGGVLVSFNIKGVSYYQCSKYFKGQCKVSHCIKREKVEKYILKQIQKDCLTEINLNMTKPKINDNIESDILNQQLERLKLKEERIVKAYQNGIDTLQEYKENKLQIKMERQKLIQELEKMKKEKPQNVKKLKKEIKKIHEILIDKEKSNKLKYKISHLLIDEIIFRKCDETLFLKYNCNTKAE